MAAELVRIVVLGSGTSDTPIVMPSMIALPVQVTEGAPQPVDNWKLKVSVKELVGAKVTFSKVDPGSPVRATRLAVPVPLKLMVPVPIRDGDNS